MIRHRTWQDVLSAAAGACFDEAGRRAAGANRPKGAADQSGPARTSPTTPSPSSTSTGVCRALQAKRRLPCTCGCALPLAKAAFALTEESPLGTATVCRALHAFSRRSKLSKSQSAPVAASAWSEPIGDRLSRFYREMEHEPPTRRWPSGGQVTQGSSRRSRHGADEERGTDTPAARASLPIDPVDALRLASMAQHEAAPHQTKRRPGLASALVERIEAWLGGAPEVRRACRPRWAPASRRALSPVQAVAVEVVETVCNRAETDPDLPQTIRTLLVGLGCRCCALPCSSQKLLSSNVTRPSSGGSHRQSGSYAAARLHAGNLPVCRGLASMVRSLRRLPRPTRRDFRTRPRVLRNLLTTHQKSAPSPAPPSTSTPRWNMGAGEVALHQASRAIYLLVGREPVNVARNFLERYWVHVLARWSPPLRPRRPQWAAACSSPTACWRVSIRRPTGLAPQDAQ